MSSGSRPAPDAGSTSAGDDDPAADDIGPDAEAAPDDGGRATGAGPIDGHVRWVLLGSVAAVVLLLDQLTKWWAVSTLDDRIIHVVWTLQLKLVRNPGSAFSLAQGQGLLISILALAAVAILLRTGRRATRPLSVVALGLVLGGALGNLADRAFRESDSLLGGSVVDFIDLQWWPVFNVADIGVVVGAGLLVLTNWRELG